MKHEKNVITAQFKCGDMFVSKSKSWYFIITKHHKERQTNATQRWDCISWNVDKNEIYTEDYTYLRADDAKTRISSFSTDCDINE